MAIKSLQIDVGEDFSFIIPLTNLISGSFCTVLDFTENNNIILKNEINVIALSEYDKELETDGFVML